MALNTVSMGKFLSFFAISLLHKGVILHVYRVIMQRNEIFTQTVPDSCSTLSSLLLHLTLAKKVSEFINSSIKSPGNFHYCIFTKFCNGFIPLMGIEPGGL